MGDLAWLRQNGLETAIRRLAVRDVPVLGICGGFQMLGRTLSDPLGAEHGGEMEGMGLLPVETVFYPEKTQTQTEAAAEAPFEGARLLGYQIHMGRTDTNGLPPFCRTGTGEPDGAVLGNVFGTYLHGLFDTGALTEKLAGWLLDRKGIDLEEIPWRATGTIRSGSWSCWRTGCAGAWIWRRCTGRWRGMTMDKGLVHVYCGSGKGKTTAAMGLALRALGRGRRVTVVQFLKDGTSGELEPLKGLGARVLAGPPEITFVSRMTPEQRERTARWNDRILEEALDTGCDLLILDELCAARRFGLVDMALARKAVLDRPEYREVVITGREPEDWMLAAADYITEMDCRRHPYQQGIAAREGIEY